MMQQTIDHSEIHFSLEFIRLGYLRTTMNKK